MSHLVVLEMDVEIQVKLVKVRLRPLYNRSLPDLWGLV